ncbi:MAG: hypothetical protein QOH18_1616 [Solirubrobacterales bacterium]|nr:hypothetical protein [Solirubrobacterales bacterium]
MEDQGLSPGFPVSFRPPAFASWVILFPLGISLPHGRPTGSPTTRTHRGSTFHTSETRPGWVPPLPRGGGVHLDGVTSTIQRLPLLNGQPCTPLPHSIGEAWDHEASSGVHLHSPVRSSPGL